MLTTRSLPIQALLFALLVFLPTLLPAQDIIVKKDNEKIKCKVLEIGEEEVTYKEWKKLQGETYAVNVDELLRIEFENGEKEVFAVEKEKEEEVIPSATTNSVSSQTITSPTNASTTSNAWEGSSTYGLNYIGSFDMADKGSFGLEGHVFQAQGTPFGLSFGFYGWYSLATKKWLENGGCYIGPNISYPISDDILLFAPICGIYSYEAKSFGIQFMPSIGIKIGNLFLSVGWLANYDFKSSQEYLEGFAIHIASISL